MHDGAMIVFPYLGSGEQGELREEALRRLAWVGGFVFEGQPSVSRWLQHLADQKIEQDGIGYYAVVTPPDEYTHLVFLSRRPVPDVNRNLWLRGEDGSLELWGEGEYASLYSAEGARDLLTRFGGQVAEAVEHDVPYAIDASKIDLDVNSWASAEIIEPAGISETERESGVHNRFDALLLEKRERDGHPWSIREVERDTGIASITLILYARHEVTRFNERTLDGLCRFFECSVGDLLVLVSPRVDR